MSKSEKILKVVLVMSGLFPELDKLDQETLFVIGNGFDLRHGIKSSYWDFRQWARANKKDVDMIENFIADIWGDVEKKLGEYDECNILDLCRPDEEFDYDHPTRSIAAVEDSPDCFFKPAIDSFMAAFKEWVNSISLDGVEKIVDLPMGGKYLTFNYTETLERIYGIPEANILHIHGSRIRGDEYIFGHNNYRDPSEVTDDNPRYSGDKIRWFYTENPYQNIIIWMNNLVKHPQRVIEWNREFFDSLRDIKRVVVLGHSFSEIDWPYFDEIVRRTGKDTPWVISYYSEEDQQRIKSFVDPTGLENANPF